ncbi:MAG: endonuclease/exonuclease/phosphatase family protein [Pirellulales bacterium]|nr:endonuclease/exonuclease/phosphatase family protein [Pirellulales bacterium]
MKGSKFIILAILAVGGWFFTQNFEIDGLKGISIRPKDKKAADAKPTPTANLETLPPRETDTVRVASFNIQVFGTSKEKKPQVMDVLAQVVRKFDVIAIQELRSKDENVVPRFVDLINSEGRHYDYVVGPRLGRSSSKEQYVFVFDSETIEVDRQALYTVDDPDDRLHREPLVGWFRVRGPPPEQAFTFSLVNIHTDPDETKTELNALDDVFRAVRDDSRQEDDVILLGDLNVSEKKLGELGEIPNIMWTVAGVPTNTRGTKSYDNIVFARDATAEFTGRGGIIDLMREFNLTLKEALQVSDHLPIWAEFSAYEGGKPGRIATRPTDSVE